MKLKDLITPKFRNCDIYINGNYLERWTIILCGIEFLTIMSTKYLGMHRFLEMENEVDLYDDMIKVYLGPPRTSADWASLGYNSLDRTTLEWYTIELVPRDKSPKYIIKNLTDFLGEK